ncbi:NAD(P)/FAD-dependent oxidoreductase [Paenimyroides tangerinum]|uniref:NAD(P)/FAD-dependent oxidoreductase n=1 Tax=Paenimyroides tangerinum TaxID=2488728 RepID=A0A3P3WGE4_9FLAO|nr:NAD(P)/FAD-dependent oxidoreductase [Paenimyroides tangerinum]RRJ91603.1 NAD(P)/FAD-dependent oxidoreductase [Paenimyroides tangerinum]
MKNNFDVIVVGGGASGFFTAINIAENNPDLRIAILERGKEVLGKVKISGGGRCNVTHACFVPNVLTKFYPRGERELRGPFHTFCTGDVIEWFENNGVQLKTEEDGRMFPVSDSSQTIIDCFLNLAQENQIKVNTSCSVQAISQASDNWILETTQGTLSSENLVMATGSNPKIWEMLTEKGHQIVSPVPSLFTFNIKDNRIKDLMGISVPNVTLKVKETKLKSNGPLLITHWGMSGPAILRLSAWGARELFDKNYQFTLQVNFLHEEVFDDVLVQLNELKLEHAKKTVVKKSPFDLTTRLWEQLVLASEINADAKWADLTKKQLVNLTNQLTNAEFKVNGKSTFKDEFVTAGGIDLKEIDFKTMQSKLFKNLYFTGEIMNVDAITGGFNFQNAWTSGFIAAQAIANK